MKERIVYNKKGEKEYVRFGLNIRIQHIILMVSTILLILTGLPLKFFTAGWAKFIMAMFGGTEGARELHHLAALALIFIGIFHLVYIAVSKTGRSDLIKMIPTKKDILDFWNQLKFFFGRAKVKSRFGRFSFIEKFDYWAVYWGFVIMIGSGLVMWLFQGKLNPWLLGEIDLSLVPLSVDNYIHAISREAHSDEALLATLAIIVWHFYNVHFNPDKFPGNKVWITGTMSEKEMEEEHPLELEEIERSSGSLKKEDKKNDDPGYDKEHEEEVILKQAAESVKDKDTIVKDNTPIKEIIDKTTAENAPEEKAADDPLKDESSKDESSKDDPGKSDFKEKK